MEASWLDIALIIPLAWGLVRGLYKGLVLTIGSFAGLILGIYLAYIYAPEFGLVLGEWFTLSPDKLQILAYLFIFLGVAIICFFIAKIVDGILKIVTLAWLNRLLGALFGVLKYALILSVLINLFELADRHIGLMSSEQKESSLLYQPLYKLVPTVLPYVQFAIEDVKAQ